MVEFSLTKSPAKTKVITALENARTTSTFLISIRNVINSVYIKHPTFSYGWTTMGIHRLDQASLGGFSEIDYFLEHEFDCEGK